MIYKINSTNIVIFSQSEDTTIIYYERLDDYTTIVYICERLLLSSLSWKINPVCYMAFCNL